MNAVFLSASVPVVGRGTFHETADPFLIQTAVRELVTSVIGHLRIVWGGHPAITPMVWAICEDLGVKYADAVVLYQSRFFEAQFPAENARFGNVVLIDPVTGDREASLRRMREAMLSRPDLTAAVFIGGMEGVAEEYEMFRRFHPDAVVLPLSAPGGAARLLAERIGGDYGPALESVDFARLFKTAL
jgi:hypothetical protein